MRRAAALAVATLLLGVGCGGGGSSPTAAATAPTPAPPAGDPSKLVVLDSSSFAALVLAAPRPSLVKFQSPT
jgi:hypothetical protein